MVTPTTARLMQATRAQLMRPTAARQWGFVYRENRVPYYQRLFQNHDGKRQWWKTDKSRVLIYPFYTMMFSSLFLSTWGMCRLVLGHKTWWYNN